MKTRFFAFGVLMALLFSVAGVMAAESAVDTVILATTINYPDAMVVAPASVKFGAPILFTDPESVPQETLDALASLNPKTVVIVGGPFVIKQAVEDSLKAKGYNVIRLWGNTQYGTAVEIARFFWADGVGKAVIVYDTINAPFENNTKELMAARVIAAREKIPVFLVPADGLPDEVNSTLVLLGIKKIVIVGSRAAIEGKLRDFAVEKMAGKDDDETIEKANEDRERTKVVIAAVADFRNVMAASVEPNEHAVVLLVNSEDRITPTVSKVLGMANITDVKVVGKPELAQKICDAFGNATTFKLECRKDGKLAKIADEVREKKLEWKAINKELKFVRLAVNCKKLFEKDDENLDDASTDVEAADEGASNVSAANATLSRAKELCEGGNFTQAMLTIGQARNEITKIKYRLRVKAARNMDSDETDGKAVRLLKSTKRLTELRDKLINSGKASVAINRVLARRNGGNGSISAAGEDKKFTVRGSKFKFAPNTISVAKGDKVKITFVNEEGVHGLCLDAVKLCQIVKTTGGEGISSEEQTSCVEGKNICTKTLAAGKSDSLEFVAHASGTVPFFCPVDGHRGLGMEGNLTVTG